MLVTTKLRKYRPYSSYELYYCALSILHTELLYYAKTESRQDIARIAQLVER